MTLLETESVKRVENVLKKYDPSFRVIVLNDTAKTAKDAALALKCELGAIVKSLLLKKGNGFVLCLISGDKKCSLNKLKKITGIKDISMANATEVKNQTGFSIGGVSPIGLKNKLDIMIDNKLNRFVNIFAAAGHSKTIFKINFKNLVNITSGQVAEISE
tara:strand:- start:719 stop:1198 length:480 start_codon:yes stop_codon:yes gene_type:complete